MIPLPPGNKPGQAGWINSQEFLKKEGTSRFCDGCGEPPRRRREGEQDVGEEGDDGPIPLKRCAKCHHAWYHDRDCQMKHFHSHKGDCRRWARTIKNEPRLESYPFVEEIQQETAADDAADANLYGRARTIWDQPGQSAIEWETTKMPRFMNQFMYEKVLLPTIFDDDQEKKVDVIMDFGCATGSLTNILRKHAKEKVIAFDISHDMIEWVTSMANDESWGGENFEAVVGCLTDMDDPAIVQFREKYRNKIDLIVAHIMLPYIPPIQTKATFLAFSDLLKPGTGKFFHVDCSRDDPLTYFPLYVTHEECDTYYKWGGLEKELLKTDTMTVSGIGGTVSMKHVIGVAAKKKKKNEEVDEDVEEEEKTKNRDEGQKMKDGDTEQEAVDFET